MAEQQKVSGSLVLKRLKTGKVVYLSLNAKGAPLFQGWNSSSDTAVPDFTQAANQPVIVPQVTASDGTTVNISTGEWKFNDVTLVFGTPSSDGWAKNTNATGDLQEGMFAYNPTTHELKVVKNVATASNDTSETLTFTAHGDAGSSNYTVTGSIELRLMRLGNSANSVIISLVDEDGNDTILSGDDDTVKLKATALVDGNVSTTGVIKWFGEDGKTQIGSTGATLTVTPAMVQGTGLIYARLYADSSSATALASDAISIRDVKDDMDVVVTLAEGSPAEWDGTHAMQVMGQLWRFSAGERTEMVTTQESQWSHDFRSSSLDTECGTVSGKNPAEVGADIWSKVKDFEDLVDFATCTIAGS